ncbi:MAG: ATP-binding protein, partial [Cyanobacteria bacterium P01_B01_bin.77]
MTLRKLTRDCYYLVDAQAPKEVQQMKACFEQEILLEEIGSLLDFLEKVFPPKQGQVRILNKAQVKKQVLSYILPELAKYESQISDLEELIDGGELANSQLLEIYILKKSLNKLYDAFKPIAENTFSAKEIERIDTSSDIFIQDIKTYKKNGEIYEEINEVEFEASELNQYTGCEIFIESQGKAKKLNLFPFLIFRDDFLHFYKRTRAVGYEYNNVINSTGYIFETKKKFSQQTFGVGFRDQQEFFWAEVIPSKSASGEITANIPIETSAEFVGREKQISKIITEIIEIPNQNGIIFGPGGVGKTALLIQLSNRLFNESNKDEIHFSNIIWVSAKRDYYNPTFDIIEKGKQQFRTLDNVFSVIFEFLNYDNMDDYSFSDRRELMLEILKEEKILLILDNFESVPSSDQLSIVKFFETDVKRVLRRQPDYFKVNITSIQQIPSGFHHIELKWLGKIDGNSLMKK